jgi:dipeptidyl aminopeptidase/acylaminoacyl peptidase
MSQNVSCQSPYTRTVDTLKRREIVVLENEGLKIFGMFHKPAGAERHPTVVMLHGLGGHKVGRYRIYVDLAETLAEAGIASFRFDFRCCGDSEGDFSQMTIDSQISDALKAIKYVSDQPMVDPDRIGLLGRSFGGAVSILAAEKCAVIKSLCLWAPVYDAQPWQQQWVMVNDPKVPPEHKNVMMTINGQVGSYRFYQQFFSLEMDRHIHAIDNIPLLLIHGLQDKSVSSEHSERYLKSREGLERETRLVQLPSSDHDFSVLEERFAAMEETRIWFKKTL